MLYYKSRFVTPNNTIQLLGDVYSQFNQTKWNSSRPSEELPFDDYFDFVSNLMMNISVLPQNVVGESSENMVY